MRYQVHGYNPGEIAENIRRCDDFMIELQKLDDAKKSALIDAITLEKIIHLDSDSSHSYSSSHALYWAHEKSKRNLIKLIGLFPKNRRVALIASAFRSDSALFSYDFNHDVFEFVGTWESFVKNLAMYVKSKNDQQIERALLGVLEFIPEDSIGQFFKEIGVAKLLSLSGIGSLLEQYDFCKTLILSEVNNLIGELEDVPAVLHKIPWNSLKRFYDKMSEKIPRLANDINAFAYVLACFPNQYSALQIAKLIDAAPASMGVDTLINDHNKLIQVVFNLNPKLRLKFLKNLGVIDHLKTRVTPEKQALKNVLRQLLPQPWETAKNQRLEFDDLTRCAASQVATIDAHKGVPGSANGQFEIFLKNRGLDVKKPDDWKQNVEVCRVWIPGLLRDCFLRPAWESDREFCQQIHNSCVNKLKILAEAGRYPEAELAMVLVSLAANKPVEANFWIAKFKAWNTWFAWEEYKDNRRVMKGLTVVCQELCQRLNFEFNSPVSITNNTQSEIFCSFVDTMKTILSNMGDADRQKIVAYFKSPLFNCLADEDRAKYKRAVIVQRRADIPFAVLADRPPPPLGYLGVENLPSTSRQEARRRSLDERSPSFFTAHPSREADLLAIVAGLQVPNNALPAVGAVVQKKEEHTSQQKLLV